MSKSILDFRGNRKCLRHILLATDGSSGAERATEVAAKLAKAMGATLSIVTVGGNLFGDQVKQLARAEGNIADALEAMSNQILHQDLYRAETVDIVDAVLGTSMDVSTLDGRVSINVPAGTQPDSMLRLRVKGLPPFGGGSRGDLYVRLQVHVPERLSDRQRRLFEQLRAARTRQAAAAKA
jgi:nucleotide-binding universal stress UspA family protein